LRNLEKFEHGVTKAEEILETHIVYWTEMLNLIDSGQFMTGTSMNLKIGLSKWNKVKDDYNNYQADVSRLSI
jgi:hypothetical protein